MRNINAYLNVCKYFVHVSEAIPPEDLFAFVWDETLTFQWLSVVSKDSNF